ncbi:MAG: MotA/TolQ/ExbB proton channel family protein [Planctomycetota bacterium]|nr:MotA/TolQ/ExbB proton channel family protein [Planctomycetota bacterium]
MISLKKNMLIAVGAFFLYTPLVGAQEGPVTTSLLSLLGDGGMLMLPIGFCSLILVMFSFERVMSLRRNRIIPRPFVRRILEQLKSGELDKREAYRLCKENKSPIAEVFTVALRKWGRPSTEVEKAVVDAGERLGNRLRKYLRLFNGISTITPLLGLLGTVIGMIRAFNAIVVVGAMGKPELLAAGIGQALITTAAGLTVAIPALIAYLYFTSRVDQILIRVDEHGQEIVRSISAEGLNRVKRKQVRLASQQQAA